MKRRGFLSMLLAAALTPPEPVRAMLEPIINKIPPAPIRMVIREEIGITICNAKALQKIAFTCDTPNKPRDILPA